MHYLNVWCKIAYGYNRIICHFLSSSFLFVRLNRGYRDKNVVICRVSALSLFYMPVCVYVCVYCVCRQCWIQCRNPFVRINFLKFRKPMATVVTFILIISKQKWINCQFESLTQSTHFFCVRSFKSKYRTEN